MSPLRLGLGTFGWERSQLRENLWFPFHSPCCPELTNVFNFRETWCKGSVGAFAPGHERKRGGGQRRKEGVPSGSWVELECPGPCSPPQFHRGMGSHTPAARVPAPARNAARAVLEPPACSLPTGTSPSTCLSWQTPLLACPLAWEEEKQMPEKPAVLGHLGMHPHRARSHPHYAHTTHVPSHTCTRVLTSRAHTDVTLRHTLEHRTLPCAQTHTHTHHTPAHVQHACASAFGEPAFFHAV